jgi:hypothetical protein
VNTRSTTFCGTRCRQRYRPNTPVTLLDSRDNVLAGRAIPERQNSMGFLPWATHVNEYEVPVSPVGNGLILRAQAYRTSLGVVGSGLFWLVARSAP